MKPILGWAAGLAFLAWGLMIGPMQVLGWKFDHLPGDAVDTRFNIFVMEHGYRYCRGLEPSFWNVRIFYPARLVTAYSDAHLGNLPVYMLLRELGWSPVKSLQLWWLGCYVLNYASMFIMLKRLGSTWLGASCGAYLFAFGITTLTPTIQHVQLAPRFFAPWILILGYEWSLRPTQGRFFIVVLLIVAQTYQTIYIGYFTCFALLVQTLVLPMLTHGQIPWEEHRRQVNFTLGSAIFGLLLLAPLFWPYIQVSPERGHFPPGFLVHFLPTPGSWITPSGVSAHACWMKNWHDPTLPTAHELELFPGFFLVGILIILAKRFSDCSQLVRCSMMTVGLVFLATVRLGHLSLYTMLFYLPAVRGIQAVSRITLIMLIPLSIMMAYWITHRRRSWLLMIVLIPAFLADHMVDWDNTSERWNSFRCSISDLESRQSLMKNKILKHDRPRLVYVYPDLASGEWESRLLRLDAMLACQELGLPCINGWSGSTPLTYSQFTERDQVLEWLTVLNCVPSEEIQGLVLIGQPGSAHK